MGHQTLIVACKKCGEEKPATSEFFYPRSKKNPILDTTCKECRNKGGRARYRANVEAIKAHKKMYREQHKERDLPRILQWRRDNVEKARDNERKSRERHREERREWNRRYRKENPDKTRHYVDRRSQQVIYTKEAREYITTIFKDPCVYCGRVAGTVDHIDPVSLGGSNDWDNLASACRACNSMKNNKLLLAFLLYKREPATLHF